MSGPNLWTAAVGTNSKMDVDLYSASNQPIAYAGTEPLAVQCWHGDDTLNVPGLVTASWTGGNPAIGRAVLTLNGVATAGLNPDFFLLRLLVTQAAGTFTGWEGWLRLMDAPGVAVPPPTYCSLQDVQDVAGEWIVKLMVETGRTGFIADRARAREWMDKIIVNRFRPAAMTDMAYLASGYSSGQLISELPDQYIVGLLANNQLMVNEDIREACAYYAVALICERQISWDKEDTFHARARYFKAKAAQTVNSIVAQFDTNGDGNPDLASNLGVFSLR
jgi:hypothetical protein